TADQSLGAAVAVEFRRVDQGHADGKTGAQRLLFIGFRTSSLSQTRRALAERRDDGAVGQFHGAGRRAWRRTLSKCRRIRQHRTYRADDRQCQAERRAISVKIATIDHLVSLFSWQYVGWAKRPQGRVPTRIV